MNILLKNITKSFNNKAVLENINLTINSGEIFGIVGADGAGKTTLIRIMLGLLAADNGQIIIDGKFSPLDIRSDTGYVPQKFSLYANLTVEENIKLFGNMYGADQKNIEDSMQEILTFTQLINFKDRLADNLSGGMKQKLALAASLMHTPKLLFLDEPTTGVDPISRREFWQLLHKINRNTNMSVIVSTPYMDEAEFCHRLAFIREGKILTCDSPDNLVASYPYPILELEADKKLTKKILTDLKINSPELLKDFWAFGNQYHLAVDHLEQQEKLRQIFQAASIPIIYLAQIDPCLEDVFVSLSEEV